LLDGTWLIRASNCFFGASSEDIAVLRIQLAWDYAECNGTVPELRALCRNGEARGHASLNFEDEIYFHLPPDDPGFVRLMVDCLYRLDCENR
jgi:hypothetical protein